MSTSEARAWTFTSGYPKSLQITKIHPPIANDIKGLGTTAHMLVKINACALNPVDIQIMNLPTWSFSFTLLNADAAKPKTCACDFSGTIIAGGRTGFIQGDEVMGLTMKSFAPYGGALAEMAEFNMENTVAIKKPKGWSHSQAAAMPLVWLTARTCIEKVARYVEDSQSKRLAVLGGSSSTGIYTILLAKKRGWKVITTSSGRNGQFVTSTLGADEHVDYTSVNVRSAIGAFKPEAVIDCVGGTGCIGLPSSKRYVTIVGDKTGRSSMGGPYTYYSLSYHAPLQWARWARGIVGLGESYDVVMLEMKTEWLEECRQLEPEQVFIDSEFSFDDAKKAYERLHTGRARGKVVVKVQTGGVPGDRMRQD